MRKLVYDPLYISKSNKLLFLSPMYQIFIFLTRIKVFDLIVDIPRGRFRSKSMNPTKTRAALLICDSVLFHSPNFPIYQHSFLFDHSFLFTRNLTGKTEANFCK